MGRLGISLIVICSLFFIVSSCFAEGVKKNSVGISTYATNITYEVGPATADDTASGLAIWGSRALTHHLALRLGYFSQEHDDFSTVDITGYDIQLLAGNNMDEEGFKIYGGIGLFTEDWEGPGGTMDFSGGQIGLGLGYNWDQVALDFWLGLRDASEYEDEIRRLTGFPYEAAAASSALILAVRF